jgi:LysM repeat protein
MKTRLILIGMVLVIVLGFTSVPTLAAPNPTLAYSPSEVIGRINAYRNGSGLYEYKQNNTLTQLAQAQADYMASTSTVSHTGPGGTRPIDRAYNANYGNGNKIFVSEIIYGGWNADVDTAITWWKNSQIHNEQMLASTYLEIGAGVASAGESTYYVAVMGWVTGISAPSDGSAGSSTNNTDTTNSGESLTVSEASGVIPAVPVVKATPNPDGSIVHVIRTGQALWTLAAVYEVPLEVLLAQNNLTEWAFVHPGDEILIQPASGEVPAAAPTASAGDVAENPEGVIGAPVKVAATQPETNSGGVVGDAISAPGTASAHNETDIVADDPSKDPEKDPASPARWIVLGAFAILLLVVLGSLFLQTPGPHPEDNDPVR